LDKSVPASLRCELDFGDLDEPESDDVPVFYVD
jgi:hypothetical protein